MVQFLISVLYVLMAAYAVYFLQDIIKHRMPVFNKQIIFPSITGLIANFFDTLGIGSFAIVTIIVNWADYLEDDRNLPGTLNVGNAIPTLMQALIFVAVVDVDGVTLISLVVSATLGALVGSRFVIRLSERKVQLTIGLAMIITGILMILTQLNLINFLGTNNTALGLSGLPLIVGILGNFILGSLMSLGVGLYAPCMAMLYILGLNPIAAYPIMMASCAGLMPVSGSSFIKSKHYNRRLALGLTLGGIIGVFIAAKLVVNIPLSLLHWLVIFVVIYAGVSYIKKARQTV